MHVARLIDIKSWEEFLTLEHTVEQEAKFELIAGEAHTEAARLATLAFGNNISADEVNSKINAGIIHDLKKRLDDNTFNNSSNSYKEKNRMIYMQKDSFLWCQT
jgi:HD superfamily phosphohydrolase YqeK